MALRTALIACAVGLFLLPSGSASAQVTGAIAGQVVGDDGLGLPGASVQIAEIPGRGASTDADGRYRIEDVPAGTYTLRASFVGYTAVEGAAVVRAGETATADFTLGAEVGALDELVVVGYGDAVRRRDLTGAVSSVAPEDLAETPVTNVAEGIQGRLPGVQVTQGTGAPGSTPQIRIRGGNSIQGGNGPLYVVDGVIAPFSALQLPPEEIASIDVLKDASATAIYGARGANGVVLITTKRGRPGRPEVTVDLYGATQSVARQLALNGARQQAEINAERQRRQGDPVTFDPATVGEGVDWQDAVLQDTPLQGSAYLGVSGGSDAFRYRVSGEALSQDGALLNTSFQRYGVRSAFDVTFSPAVTLATNLNLSRFGQDQFASGSGPDDSIILLSQQVYPTTPIYNADGTYNYNIDIRNPDVTRANPVERLLDEVHTRARNTLNGSAQLTVRPLEGLSYRLNAGYALEQDDDRDYLPRTTFLGRPVSGVAGRARNDRQNWLLENTLSYTRDVGAHTVSVLGGFTAQQFTFEGASAGARGFFTDLLEDDNLSAGASETFSVDSYFSRNALVSTLGRLNYDYADRYLVTLSGRYDGSSRFGANNKYAFFPAAALAWVVSDEPALRGLRDGAGLDFLKVRASYGTSGNEALGNYQTLALFNPVPVLIGADQERTALRQIRLANPDLRWETTTQVDGGVEAAFAGSRLRLQADVYWKETDDLLFARPLPALTGYGSVLTNVGSVRNRGVELTLGGDLVQQARWGLSVDGNIGLNRNEVLDLGDVDELIYGSGVLGQNGTNDFAILRVGEPVGSFRVYESCGIFASEAEVEGTVAPDNASVGSQCVVDRDGDGRISEDDRYVAGSSQPDFTFGVNTALRLGAVELTTLWQGVVGNELVNFDTYNNLERLQDYYEGYFREGRPDARYVSPDRIDGRLLTDEFVESGTYLRLRTLTLSFTVPAALARGVGASRARLYATGQNLITFTGFTGNNPEATPPGEGADVFAGAAGASYPVTRVLTLGVNVGF